MKILLFGKNGQVGRELQRSLPPLGSLIALDRQSQDMCGDLANLEGLAQTIREVKPDIIVNAAAYTAVDKAETESEKADLINAQAPTVLAEEAHKCGALLIHYSTDYVFDGSGSQPWLESDAPAPLNVYGASKRDGERGIQSSGARHLIFRTSWVHATHGANFIKTILRLAKERDQLTIINDQIGAPTSAALIADMTTQAISTAKRKKNLEGLYHLAATGETSWHGYAQFIVSGAKRAGIKLKTSPATILPISSDQFPTAAKRPLNSRLNTTKFEQSFGLVLPAWQQGAARTLDEILAQE